MCLAVEMQVELYYNPSPHDYGKDCFTTEALESGTMSFNISFLMGTSYIPSISYSTDDGENWVTTSNTNNKSSDLVITVNVQEGDKVLWKSNSKRFGGSVDSADLKIKSSFFSSTCEFDVMGNILSLMYGDNFKNVSYFQPGCNYAFYLFFKDYRTSNPKDCKVVNARNLILPEMVVYYCYSYMFYNCASLLTAPELSADTLDEGCYSNMFNGCSNLNRIKMMATSISATDCLTNWVNGDPAKKNQKKELVSYS